MAKGMKMSKQEVKDEGRQTDLPPEIKGAIRRRQMMAARARMMAAIPTADVVVTNPTHYAVALKYDGSLPAPIVVAKGKNLVAAQIRRIATETQHPHRARSAVGEVTARDGPDRPDDPGRAVRRRGAGAGIRLQDGWSKEDRRMNEQSVRKLLKHTDLIAAVGVVLLVSMLVIPLPAAVLDLMITCNISGALAIVVATMYINKALEFSAFPTLLLLTTMFRLAINVSVTRLVLTTGNAGSVVAVLRSVRGRRQRGGRSRHLHDPHRHPVRGGHQRCRPRRRGVGALHPGRHAR